MGFGDKFKVVKQMADMQSGAIKSKLLEFEKKDQHFKEKELELLGKFEKKLDDNFTLIHNELRTIRALVEQGRQVK